MLKQIFSKIVTITLGALLSSFAFSEEIVGNMKIGDVAPFPTDLIWLNGKPITEFKKGDVYVLYYWGHG